MSDSGQAPAAASRLPLAAHALALALIALAVSPAYLPPLRGHRVYLSQDTGDIAYATLRSHIDDLERHGFIAWCPGVGTGHYRAANPTYGLYSIRALIYLAVPGYAAQVMAIVFYAFWAGVGAYLLGLALGRNFFAGLFLGLIWPLAGVVTSMTANIPYLAAAAWLPWALAAWFGLDRLATRAAATGAALALVAAEGDLFGAGITLAAISLLALWSPVSGSRKKEALAVGAAAIVLAGLAAVVWMPALAFLPESRRAAGLDLSQATAFSLHPLRIVNLFAPRFFGQGPEQSFWANSLTTSLTGHGFWFQTVYLGLLAPLFALAALVRPHPQRRLAVALLGAAGLFFILAGGRHTPLAPWLMEHVQALRAFRYPAKLFTWTSLFLLAAAGLGIAPIMKSLENDRSRRRIAMATLVISALVLTSITILAANSIEEIKSISPLPALSFLRIRQDLLRLGLFAAGVPGLILLLGRREGLRRRALPVALIGISALDLLTALPNFQTGPIQDLDRPATTAQAIRAAGSGRLLIDDNLYQFLTTGPRTALMPNWGLLDNLEYAFGKTATLPARMEALYYGPALTAQGAAVFRVLAARWVLAPLGHESDWVAELERQGVIKKWLTLDKENIVIFAAAEAAPKVMITREVRFLPSRDQALAAALDNPAPGARLTYIAADEAVSNGARVRPAPTPPVPALVPLSGNDRVLAVTTPDGDHETVSVSLDAPAWIVIREYLLPGWQARLDGQPTCLYWADGISRAVFAPAGKHELAFAFRPPELRRGAWLSVATALILILALLGDAWRRSSPFPRCRN